MTMRRLFVSYARENKREVDEMVSHLETLGYQAWIDSALRGGQSWWEEILRRIAECDVFLAIVTRNTLNSVACKRELEWALALNRPVLPIALERLPEALPSQLSIRQIVDYSRPGHEAAFALAGGLAAIPPAPPIPEELPKAPLVPLSYLSDLADQVSQAGPLTHEQQRQIIAQVETALRSADREEQQGGQYILDNLSKRGELYADVDRALARLREQNQSRVQPGAIVNRTLAKLLAQGQARMPGATTATDNAAQAPPAQLTATAIRLPGPTTSTCASASVRSAAPVRSAASVPEPATAASICRASDASDAAASTEQPVEGCDDLGDRGWRLRGLDGAADGGNVFVQF